jgi:hypothetical protein
MPSYALQKLHCLPGFSGSIVSKHLLREHLVPTWQGKLPSLTRGVLAMITGSITELSMHMKNCRLWVRLNVVPCTFLNSSQRKGSRVFHVTYPMQKPPRLHSRVIHHS